MLPSWQVEGEIRTLVHQTIQWATRQTIKNPHPVLLKLAEAITEIVDPILVKYVRDLSINQIKTALTMFFKNRTPNWGTVVAIFAFCAVMAHQNEHMSNDYFYKIENQFTEGLYKEIAMWF